MVITGFSRIHVAVYSNSDTTVTYTKVQELARARAMTLSVETAKENAFYANNVLSEVEPAMFTSGNVDIEVDGLSPEEEGLILGLTSAQVADVEEYAFGDNLNPPYMGVGAVIRKQMKGTVTYHPCILTKVRFNLPEVAAKTQEESIDWQSQKLTAVVMRDDTANHVWQIIPKAGYATEAEAVAWIKKKLGGT